MKKNSTIKILVFTVVSFILAQGCANTSVKTQDKGGYTEEVVQAAGVSEAEILSKKIDIKIEKSQDEKLHYFYNKNDNCKDKQIESSNKNQIKIDFSKIEEESDSFFNFSSEKCVADKDAKATIQLPLSIKTIKVETVSGDIKISEVSSETMKLASVSGDQELLGKVKELKSTTVSGDVKFQSDILDPNVKVSTVSGDVEITFNEMPDINLQFSTVNGDASFDKSFSNTEIDGSVKNLKFGKGSGEIEIHTVSGDAKILKSER